MVEKESDKTYIDGYMDGYKEGLFLICFRNNVPGKRRYYERI